ncbi:MAG TPA: J domain-containing protein [Candidatus Limnocylindrales bacterium]
MAKRDPHDVLGVSHGASMATIKGAWRRLARTHHPDLTGDDPAASRIATRRMAEINEAYESLRRAAAEQRAGVRGWPPADRRSESGSAAPRAGGPPRARPTRPVTGRLDTSGSVRPRNATTSHPRATHRGHVPLRPIRPDREPPRASDPSGPLERGRANRFRRPRRPSLERARAVEVEFGKFRGHTLGQIADFEPSYLDWLARTILRDPDLIAAARVVVEDLDRRGVGRRSHPQREPGRSA